MATQCMKEKNLQFFQGMRAANFQWKKIIHQHAQHFALQKLTPAREESSGTVSFLNHIMGRGTKTPKWGV